MTKTTPVRLGLDPELCEHGSFMTHGLDALAHLREAWLSADPGNEPTVAAAIRALLQGHSMKDNLGECRTVLAAGLTEELAAEFWELVGL